MRQKWRPWRSRHRYERETDARLLVEVPDVIIHVVDPAVHRPDHLVRLVQELAEGVHLRPLLERQALDRPTLEFVEDLNLQLGLLDGELLALVDERVVLALQAALLRVVAPGRAEGEYQDDDPADATPDAHVRSRPGIPGDPFPRAAVIISGPGRVNASPGVVSGARIDGLGKPRGTGPRLSSVTQTTTITDQIARLGILPAGRLARAARLEAAAADARTFLADLVRRGWLTRLQAVQIGRGRGHHLTVGNYLLLDRLGSGGMGRVFLARHRGLGRLAAVKLVRLDRRHCPATRMRFLREVRLVGRLNHANVVHAYDAGADHGSLYLAMEYLPGADLGRVVVAEGALDPGRACEYARQAALGLQHLHARGLIHRDVKPSNLALAAGGRVVKVLDIGLARRKKKAGVQSDRPRRGLGSPDYAAPEQIADAQRVDSRADLYGLGCTLYHLLTGRVPFRGGNAARKLMRHLTDTPRPVEELRPDLPVGLGDVVRRLMARRPEDRFKTAAEAAAALAPFAVAMTEPAQQSNSNGPNAQSLPTDADMPTKSEFDSE